MQERISYGKVAPGSLHAMRQLQNYVDESGLEQGLIQLIDVRASQINGCAY